MPTPVIVSFAKKSGKSEAEVEKHWNELKKEYGDNYEAIVGTLKKILKITEDTTSGGTVSGDIAKDVPRQGGVQTRIMPFTDFVKQNKKKFRVYHEDETYKDFDDFDTAHAYYTSSVEKGMKVGQPISREN